MMAGMPQGFHRNPFICERPSLEPEVINETQQYSITFSTKGERASIYCLVCVYEWGAVAWLAVAWPRCRNVM